MQRKTRFQCSGKLALAAAAVLSAAPALAQVRTFEIQALGFQENNWNQATLWRETTPASVAPPVNGGFGPPTDDSIVTLATAAFPGSTSGAVNLGRTAEFIEANPRLLGMEVTTVYNGLRGTDQFGVLRIGSLSLTGTTDLTGAPGLNTGLLVSGNGSLLLENLIFASSAPVRVYGGDFLGSNPQLAKLLVTDNPFSSDPSAKGIFHASEFIVDAGIAEFVDTDISVFGGVRVGDARRQNLSRLEVRGNSSLQADSLLMRSTNGDSEMVIERAAIVSTGRVYVSNFAGLGITSTRTSKLDVFGSLTVTPELAAGQSPEAIFFESFGSAGIRQSILNVSGPNAVVTAYGLGFSGFGGDTESHVTIENGAKVQLISSTNGIDNFSSGFGIFAGQGSSSLTVTNATLETGFLRLYGNSIAGKTHTFTAGPSSTVTVSELLDFQSYKADIRGEVFTRELKIFGAGSLVKVFAGGQLLAQSLLMGGELETGSKNQLTIQGRAELGRVQIGVNPSIVTDASTLEINQGGAVVARNISAGVSYLNFQRMNIATFAFLEPGQVGNIQLSSGGRLTIQDLNNPFDPSVLRYVPTLALAMNATLTLDGTSAVNIGGSSEPFIAGAVQLLGPSGGNAGGELVGTGTVNGAVINNGGMISSAFSPGTLTIDGDLIQNSGSILFEIGGMTPGVDYDQLVVTGDISLLGGTIEIVPINGFVIPPSMELALFSGFDNFTFSTANVQFVTPDGLFFQDFDPATGKATVGNVPIPEPACLSLVALSASMLVRRRRQIRGRAEGR